MPLLSEAQNEKAKSILKSKTFMVAVLQALLGILAAVEMQSPGIGAVAVGKSILDIALRLVTSQPVTLSL